VQRLVVSLLAPIHARLQVAHQGDYMNEVEHKSKISLYIIIVLAVIVIAVIVIATVEDHTKAVAVTTNITSTITAYMQPPSIAGASLISSSAIPAPAKQLENNMTGSYLAVYSFPNNSNEMLLIRMLRYSNSNSAYNAYLFITNYTFNSTAISMPALPSGYAGIYITSQPGMLYSITTHKDVYTVTATLLGSNKNLSNARNYLEQVIAAALQKV